CDFDYQKVENLVFEPWFTEGLYYQECLLHPLTLAPAIPIGCKPDYQSIRLHKRYDSAIGRIPWLFFDDSLFPGKVSKDG
ncbi:MAG TPA: hypothetical protein V6D50_07625, partial [Chroococcales cyanobacterium]